MQDGETNILAKYNIRTYTFDYQDKQSTGNKTRIESYKGDIYLGYSTKKDGCQQPAQTDFYHDDYDKSIFRYTVSDANVDGQLDILAGFKDATNNGREGGGNIYVTHMVNTMKAGGSTRLTSRSLIRMNTSVVTMIGAPEIYTIAKGSP